MRIPERESLYVEFKSDVDYIDDSEIIDAVVGFANAQGGELYIGVENDGKVTGLNKKHKSIEILGAMIANRTVPPQSVRVEAIVFSEKTIARIEVPKSKSIVSTTGGKILRRRIRADGEPEVAPLYPHEISSRLSELNLLDLSAQPVPDASYTDLDSLERDRLRELIRMNRSESTLLELGDEELDKALQFIASYKDTFVPTYTGMLLIGKEESIKKHIPTAKITFQVLEGTEVRVNNDYSKPILALVSIIEERLKAWNPEREIEIGFVRLSVPDYNHRAIREAVINAFSHRDYSVLGRIRIELSDTGLTISNPGGFIEGVTYKNLLSVEPHGRNPALADALKRIGLAERTGRGIDRIYEGSLVYGRPLPDYSNSTQNNVTLFIQRSDPDTAFTKMVTDIEGSKGRPLSIISLLILSLIKDERRVNIKRIIESTNIGEHKARAAVESLLEEGLIEAKGSGKNRTYILSANVYGMTKNHIGYIRQSDVHQLRYGELIMELVKRQGFVNRSDVVELLHIPGMQAYRLLNKLVKEGKLTMVGRTRNAKYIEVNK